MATLGGKPAIRDHLREASIVQSRLVMLSFLVILLHKPFDSMTLCTLMATGKKSALWRYAANGLFALAVPLGAVLYFVLSGQRPYTSTKKSAPLPPNMQQPLP